MDLFETLGLGPRQPEENELYVAIYMDPTDTAVDAGDGGLAGFSMEGTSPSKGAPCVPEWAEDGHAAPSPAGKNRLEALRARCTAWLLPHTTDYVWNKDPLVLRASSRQAPPWERRRGLAAVGRRGTTAAGADRTADRRALDGGRPSVSDRGGGGEGCVWAVMRFGDAVDDEWWAVWLLLRMTRELQDISVQVWDNDGQFLLIEAAYALPRWLKPETADNRVWLRRGRLHVIPLPSPAAPDLPPAPSVAQALEVLREGRFATASQRVQRPIDERLVGYPARARRQQQHVARCLLPAPLAAVLRSEPQLVAELVEGFYLRDAEDMRAAARMHALPPSLDRVPALVRMTRCHYAQLSQQRFSAPRGLVMPPPDSPLVKAADLGLKLTVAAEIICARQRPHSNYHSHHHPASGLGTGDAAAAPAAAPAEPQPQRETTPLGDAVDGAAAAAGVAASGGGAVVAVLSEARFAGDPGWRRFKASLEGSGYFQENIPGSRRYKELLAAALEAYAVGIAAAEEDGRGEATRDPRRRLAELIAAAAAVRPEDVADPPGSSMAEDDDSWLDQQPESLQAELERRKTELEKHVRHRADDEQPAGDCSAAGDSSQPRAQQNVKEVDADEIASKLRGFMEQLSGLEGIETSVACGAGGSCSGVDFDPARFLRELEQVLGAVGGASVRAGKRQRRLQAEGRSAQEDGEEEEEEEEDRESSTEGSSFFSSNEEDGNDDEGCENASEGEEELDEAGADGRTVGQATEGTVTCQNGAFRAGGGGASRGPEGAYQSQPRPVIRPGFLAASRLATKATVTDAKQKDGTAAVGSTAAAARAAGAARGPAAAASVAAAIAAGGVSCGNSALRRQDAWEVRTATDSDDDERGSLEEAGSDTGSEAFHEDMQEREYDENEYDNARDATTKLLEALGVEVSGDGGGGNRDDDAARRGSVAAAAGRIGSAGSTHGSRCQQRSATGVHTSVVGGGGRASAIIGDVGNGDGFMSLYDSALQAELAGTTLAQSFDVALGAPGSGARAAAGAAEGGAGGAGGMSGATTGAAATQPGLQPVDLDMNLVRNLLRSYTAQQGSAGPAGNMAAMLGMALVAGEVEE